MERQTKQKALIYEALQKLNHPTATEVYAYVHAVNPRVSRATVFRVLNSFAATGKALELRMAGCDVRYDDFTERHYHAHCRTCGRVVDVEASADFGRNVFAEATDGFSVEGYSVEFYGTCFRCKAMKKA